MYSKHCYFILFKFAYILHFVLSLYKEPNTSTSQINNIMRFQSKKFIKIITIQFLQ